MKSLIFLLFLSPICLSQNKSVSEISKALSSGDVNVLSQFFDNTVDIAILDQENTYTKDRASALIKEFFVNYPPQRFSQMHQGRSKGQDSQFCIGNLTTSKLTFRVYIYMKVEGEQDLIKELRFDKE